MCAPPQVGLIMYFVRTPCEWGMDAISATLTFLWEVVGYVEGLFFKDLKQTMKKEQCEVKLLVTASMPGEQTAIILTPFSCSSSNSLLLCCTKWAQYCLPWHHVV